MSWLPWTRIGSCVSAPPDGRADLRTGVRPRSRSATCPATPTLVAQGDRDTINPLASGQAVYDQAGPPRWLLRLEGAGHLPPFAGGTVARLLCWDRARAGRSRESGSGTVWPVDGDRRRLGRRGIRVRGEARLGRVQPRAHRP